MPSRRNFLRTPAGVLSPGLSAPKGDTSVRGTPSSALIRGRLFSADLPPFEWQEFRATGYSVPVTGIIYRTPLAYWFVAEDRHRSVSGMPLGGIDTGGLDLEGS